VHEGVEDLDALFDVSDCVEGGVDHVDDHDFHFFDGRAETKTNRFRY